MTTLAHWYFVVGAFSLGLFLLSGVRGDERPKTVAAFGLAFIGCGSPPLDAAGDARTADRL